MIKTKEVTGKQSELAKFVSSFKKNWVMYLFLIIPIIYFVVFKYTPMVGNWIAFSKYKLGGGFFGEEFK